MAVVGLVITARDLPAQGFRVAAPAEEEKPIPTGYDRYDMRAADEPDRSEQFRQVIKSFERERWDDAATGMQSLLEGEQDSLFRGSDKSWQPLWRALLEQWMAQPEAARSAYIDRYAVTAQRALDAAQKANDWEARFRLARHYLATPAGQAATRDIINLAIDQGDVDAVSMRLSDLLLVRSTLLSDAEWRGEVVAFLQSQRRLGLIESLSDVTGAAIPTPLERLPARSTAPIVSEWRTVLGHPSGFAQAQLDEAVLIPRWRHSLVAIPAVRAAYAAIELTLSQEYGEFLRPICGVVASQGVIVARTPTGLVSLEARTGTVLWENQSLVRKESSLDEGEVFDEEGDSYRGNQSRLYFQGRDALQTRLTSLGVFGVLSTDGERVFEVVPWQTVSRDRAGVLWVPTREGEAELVHNVVYARNLRTGRIEWSLGGPESDELPGWPASGTYFFGPPTPDGEELFAIGEHRGDIFLFCFQADTGELLWRQLLASPGLNIHRDYVRAQWAAVPSVRAGLVVCPTTTGWLVAVDRQTRRIRWASRLVDRSENDEGRLGASEENRDYGINRRHAPSQPIIVGDRVLLAPMEFPDEQHNHLAGLMGFDSETGRRLWEVDGEELGSIPGMIAVTETQAVEGRHALRLIDIQGGLHGEPVFRRNEESPQGLLQALPLLTTDGLLIPTADGTLARLTLRDGELPVQTEFPAAPPSRESLARVIDPRDRTLPRLGQLATLDGLLISVSPWEVVVWERLADVALWKEQAARDPRSALRYAQYLVTKGQAAAAHSILAAAEPLAESAELKAQIREVRVAVLLMMVEAALRKAPPELPPDDLWEELQNVVIRPEDEAVVHILAMERELLRQNWLPAWELVQTAIRTPSAGDIARPGQTSSRDVWLAQMIHQLATAPAPHRAELRAALQTEFQARWDTEPKPEQRRRLLRIFGELPGVPAKELSILLDPQNTEPTMAGLDALSRSEDRTVARAASLALIERLLTPDWAGEARQRIERHRKETDWSPPDQQRLDELAQQLEKLPPPASAATWAGEKVTLLRKREASDLVPPCEPSIVRWGDQPITHSGWVFHYDEERAALQVQRVDGSIYAEFPLASNELNDDDESSPVVTVQGFTCFARHMSVLHAFSLPEKRLLWRRSVTGSPPEIVEDDADQVSDFVPLRDLVGLPEENSSGWIRSVTDRYLVLADSQSFQVLDRFTGQELWRSTGTLNALCDGEYLLLAGDQTLECRLLRDGRVLQLSDEVRAMYASAELTTTAFDSPDLIRQRNALKGAQQVITIDRLALRPDGPAAATPSTDRWDQSDRVGWSVVWTLDLPEYTWIAHGLPGTRLLVSQDGTVQQLVLQTGQVTTLGQLPESLRPIDEVTLWVSVDPQRIYLYRTESSETVYQYASDDPAQKQLVSFPLRNDLASWTVALEGAVDTHRFRNAPFLPEYRREEIKIGDAAFERVQITLRDKSTGQPIHQFQLSRPANSVYGIGYDPLRRRFSINTETELIRMEVRSPLLLTPAPSP